MHKTFVVLGAVVIVFAGLLSVAQAAPDSWVRMQLASLWDAIGSLQLLLDSQPEVLHVVIAAEECTFVEGVGNVGWCPDGQNTSFRVLEPFYVTTATVIGEAATPFSEEGLEKRMQCPMRSVIYGEGGLPYVGFLCEAPPIAESILVYTLIAHDL
ncbi:MAG: hypothetical protein HY369_05315 [Candidatus Aenigmarchaeota archaeon]|nr:hypothetical protein [Candidatus Aenigmarchaeota archaeon]